MVPNASEGVLMRALAAQAAEHEQQRLNDKAIAKVLAHFVDGDQDIVGMVAPESLHTVNSMETCNINL